ncbi:MAG: SpoIID/LytB domain-containing protein [Candidatus Sumerlaeales bacterium]|nr:SpoIID/LytB domain-containing protein [Candidatus Sumerlaeales bacterium]
MKVYLSPSNQPKNMCKLGHSEKEHCEALAYMLTPFLDAYGVEYRFRPAGLSLSQSVKDATDWGAQLYVPMHTNAAGGTAMGTRFGFYPGRMDSSNACNIFKKNWLKIYPYSEKVKTGTYTFYEAKNPVCPSVYCELVFHDNITDATWFHQNTDTIARNIAQSIADFFGVGSKPIENNEEPKLPATETKDDHIVNIKLTKQENAYFYKKNIGDIISLPTEQYLLGVVPAEVGNAHIEACKAQAVAARSIVRYWTRSGATITDSSSHQSYRAPRGANTAYGNAHKAVVETAGQVLMYGGKVAQTYFADSNGGKMVASKEHWSADIPYLVTKDDPWTKASGKPYNGHPVGMSQQGAIWAANNGVKYQDILAFYYPGTMIETENVKPATMPSGNNNPETKPAEEKPTQPVLSSDALYFAEVITRNPASLNIWSNTKKNRSMKIVPRGMLVEVLQIIDGTWAKVRFEGVTGYSDRQYLKRQDEPSDVMYMAKVKTRFPLSLNIWQNPNKGKSLTKVPNKETVEVLQEYNYTWAKIRYKGTVGYSDRQYLEKV